MKNKKGFATKEIIILSGVLAIFFAVAITKVSFALKEANKEDEIYSEKMNVLAYATKAYISMNKDKFDNEETFLYGSDLIKAGFLVDIEDTDYKNAKIKVTHSKDKEDYNVEVVE